MSRLMFTLEKRQLSTALLSVKVSIELLMKIWEVRVSQAAGHFPGSTLQEQMGSLDFSLDYNGNWTMKLGGLLIMTHDLSPGTFPVLIIQKKSLFSWIHLARWKASGKF